LLLPERSLPDAKRVKARMTFVHSLDTSATCERRPREEEFAPTKIEKF
jgi:hypothetical protein